MAAIGISASISGNNKQSIYTAQHHAVMLELNAASTSQDLTIQYFKKCASGYDFKLNNLRGIFFEEGSELLVQASANCQVEAMLMSRSTPKDYAVRYPSGAVTASVSDFSIDPNVCKNCANGARVLRLEANYYNQILLTANVSASVKSDSVIKVCQWKTDPKCPPLIEGTNYEQIAQLFDYGGKLTLTLDRSPLYLSFLARPANNSDIWDLLCCSVEKNGNAIDLSLLAFSDANNGGGGGY